MPLLSCCVSTTWALTLTTQPLCFVLKKMKTEIIFVMIALGMTKTIKKYASKFINKILRHSVAH